MSNLGALFPTALWKKNDCECLSFYISWRVAWVGKGLGRGDTKVHWCWRENTSPAQAPMF